MYSRVGIGSHHRQMLHQVFQLPYIARIAIGFKNIGKSWADVQWFLKTPVPRQEMMKEGNNIRATFP